MSSRIIALQAVKPGDILAEDIFTLTGRSLLSAGMLLTERTIALLGAWNIPTLAVQDTNQTAADSTVSPRIIDACLRFFEEYESIVNMTEQAFAFVRDQKKIPVQFLKDTSFGIYSSILEKGTVFMDYLMITDYKLADKITRHSIIVAYIAGMLARQLKMNDAQVEGVTLAGLLHDIGKLIVSNSGGLDLKNHVLNAMNLLNDLDDIPRDVFLGIAQHHELMDGSGYPLGVPSRRIHPYARILAVANFFHTRAYCGDYTNPFPALEYITEERFTSFDPAVCCVFLKRTRDSLLHTNVVLGDGRIAEIIYYNTDLENPCYPIVRTRDNTIIDLAVNRAVKIRRIAIPDYFPMLGTAG